MRSLQDNLGYLIYHIKSERTEQEGDGLSNACFTVIYSLLFSLNLCLDLFNELKIYSKIIVLHYSVVKINNRC